MSEETIAGRVIRGVSIDPADLMPELAADARALDTASDRLGMQIKLSEGAKEGELGIRHRWEAALDLAHDEVHAQMLAEAEDSKLTAALKTWPATVIASKARVKAKNDNMQLWLEYCECEAEIRALEKYLRGRERSSSLRQSILSAQKQSRAIE